LLAYTLYGQELQWGDLSVIGLLIILEGVLSIDNALVLGLLAKRLPPHQRTRALTYGLVGAFVFRFIAVATATYLLQWRWVKLIGGGYLVYIAVKHLFFESKESHDEQITVDAAGQLTIVGAETGEPLTSEEEALEIEQRSAVPVPEEVRRPSSTHGYAKFWPTVMVIEFTDIAFAVDSILAAIALVGAPPADHPAESFHPKLWVVIAGGLMGVVLMRFAAAVFIRLLERFPRFETAAYLLVIVIGAKLLVDWGFNSAEHPHRVDFHDWQNPAFWVFWGLMIVSFCIGFIPSNKKKAAT
jgi:YkoY family integral membrane protein